MQIQSLSIVVPNKECVNKCPFCVSRMVSSNSYPNLMDINHPHYDINVKEYLKRLRFVADNGCQTPLMLTGTSEPQQNKQFLATFALLHQQIGSPFTNIEMQTTGVMLDQNRDYIRFLRNFVRINTIALSINSLDDEENCRILGQRLIVSPSDDYSPADVSAPLELKRLCDLLRDYDFNIRCCFNLTDKFNKVDIQDIMNYSKTKLHANQITFRNLYFSNDTTEQSQWIREHQITLEFTHNLKDYLKSKPTIGTTAYGSTCYDVDGMSVIYDVDCMGKNPKTDVKKYLILRPNCKLYSQWDSPASLVF